MSLYGVKTNTEVYAVVLWNGGLIAFVLVWKMFCGKNISYDK